MAAVLAYRSPSEGYAKRRRVDAPVGFVSLADFAAASGLAWGTLHRRLAAQEIASVKMGQRRFIPDTPPPSRHGRPSMLPVGVPTS